MPVTTRSRFARAQTDWAGLQPELVELIAQKLDNGNDRWGADATAAASRSRVHGCRPFPYREIVWMLLSLQAGAHAHVLCLVRCRLPGARP
jgi:hypothetical protein